MNPYAVVKSFDLSVEIECLSKKCNPNQMVGGGKTWTITKSSKWIHGKGCQIGRYFKIVDGNNCCFSSELYLCDTPFNSEFTCPNCAAKYEINLV